MHSSRYVSGRTDVWVNATVRRRRQPYCRTLRAAHCDPARDLLSAGVTGISIWQAA